MAEGDGIFRILRSIGTQDQADFLGNRGRRRGEAGDHFVVTGLGSRDGGQVYGAAQGCGYGNRDLQARRDWL